VSGAAAAPSSPAPSALRFVVDTPVAGAWPGLPVGVTLSSLASGTGVEVSISIPEGAGRIAACFGTLDPRIPVSAVRRGSTRRSERASRGCGR
jgi:hypothetical protein